MEFNSLKYSGLYHTIYLNINFCFKLFYSFFFSILFYSIHYISSINYGHHKNSLNISFVSTKFHNLSIIFWFAYRASGVCKLLSSDYRILICSDQIQSRQKQVFGIEKPTKKKIIITTTANHVNLLCIFFFFVCLLLVVYFKIDYFVY